MDTLNLINEIPLYKDLYGEQLININLNDTLDQYPILERNHIVDGFPNNWMTSNLKTAIDKDSIETTTTSGTSGNRIQIIRKKSWWIEEYRRTYKHSPSLKNFNVGTSKKAILTTAICSNASCYLDFPTYEDRIISNTLYLNLNKDPNNWTKTDIERMLLELNKFKPEYLDADPIYLGLFLKMLEEHNILTTLHTPKFISLSYEMVPRFTRRFIESRMNCAIGNFYGTTELGYIYLEHNEKIIRCPELSKVEFLPLSQEKGLYYLIISSIKNEYMPFLRFRVGDIVKINSNINWKNFNDDTQIEFFCGREKDIVFNERGDPITPGEIDCSLGKLENNLLIYQIEVRNKNDILFRYLTINNAVLSEENKDQITSKLFDFFGSQLKVQFKLERSISPESSGKFSLLKQV